MWSLDITALLPGRQKSEARLQVLDELVELLAVGEVLLLLGLGGNQRGRAAAHCLNLGPQPLILLHQFQVLQMEACLLEQERGAWALVCLPTQPMQCFARHITAGYQGQVVGSAHSCKWQSGHQVGAIAFICKVRFSLTSPKSHSHACAALIAHGFEAEAQGHLFTLGNFRCIHSHAGVLRQGQAVLDAESNACIWSQLSYLLQLLVVGAYLIGTLLELTRLGIVDSLALVIIARQEEAV